MLSIRGELLKRYPNAVIYAHRACWQRLTGRTIGPDPCERSGTIDTRVSGAWRAHRGRGGRRRRAPRSARRSTRRRSTPTSTSSGSTSPRRTRAAAPARSRPTTRAGSSSSRSGPASRDSGSTPAQQPAISVWNDLSWPDVQPGPAGSFIEIAAAPATFPLVTPSGADEEKLEQFQDDTHVVWSHDMSAAELAYILFQAPVLVGVHASEMLPR